MVRLALVRFLFFFSSRRRHTSSFGDWSSDVCSSDPVASGVIAASGTLAQIIPPSLVLIVMADQLGRSVGDLYKGAIIPGFTLTALYVSFVVAVSVFRPSFAPALPPEARKIREDDGSPGLKSLGVVTLLALAGGVWFARTRPDSMPTDELIVRSEERRVGKECRSR